MSNYAIPQAVKFSFDGAADDYPFEKKFYLSYSFGTVSYIIDIGKNVSPTYLPDPGIPAAAVRIRNRMEELKKELELDE